MFIEPYSTMKPNLTVVMICVMLSIALNFKTTFCIRFNTTGFEFCVFNLADFNRLPNTFSRDLTEKIIGQTLGVQRWTLTSIVKAEQIGVEESDWKAFMSHQHSDPCSVNIAITDGSCNYTKYKASGIEVRPWLEEDILIILQDEKSKCIQKRLMKSYLAVAFHIVVTKKFEASAAYTFCPACVKIYQIIKLPLHAILERLSLRYFKALLASCFHAIREKNHCCWHDVF